jgi:ATP-dependent DNA ligase
MPRVVHPRLQFQPPEGKHWIHEVKHDGYRAQLVIEGATARVYTRNGYDWSSLNAAAAARQETRAAVDANRVSVQR